MDESIHQVNGQDLNGTGARKRWETPKVIVSEVPLDTAKGVPAPETTYVHS